MPTKVLLLTQNPSYARSLARTLPDVTDEFVPTVCTRQPLTDRIQALRSDVDLIHVDECMVNGPLAAIFKGDRPLVVAFRGWADYTNAHGEHGRFEAASIRQRVSFVRPRADSTICFGNVQRDVLQGDVGLNGVSVTGRPIESHRYRQAAMEVYHKREGTRLVTATNLRYWSKYQGVQTLLLALRPLFDHYEGLRFEIAGDGRYLRRLKDYVDEYEHADRVTVHGWVNDIPKFLAGADGFLYASSLDAYPTSVLEAQAAGLPVIAVDGSGVPDVVGEAGALCSPRPSDVRNAIQQLVDNEQFRQSLASASQQKMNEHNRQTTQRHVDVWREATR